MNVPDQTVHNQAVHKKYARSFFEDQHSESSRSAAKVVPLVSSILKPHSVVDVGCGIGCWAAEFLAQGAAVAGVDGDWVDRSLLQIPDQLFVSHDLRQPLRLDRRFDLAVCIEVAEHLPESRASGLVEDLVRLAPCVLFSAAVPQQGGTDHINEQPLSYWGLRFAQHEYHSVDCIRPLIWEDEGVAWWFRQNIVVFADGRHFLLTGGARKAVDLYHPGYVASLQKRTMQPGLRVCLRALPDAIRQAAKARLKRLKSRS